MANLIKSFTVFQRKTITSQWWRKSMIVFPFGWKELHQKFKSTRTPRRRELAHCRKEILKFWIFVLHILCFIYIKFTEKKMTNNLFCFIRCRTVHTHLSNISNVSADIETADHLILIIFMEYGSLFYIIIIWTAICSLAFFRANVSYTIIWSCLRQFHSFTPTNCVHVSFFTTKNWIF